MFKRLTIFALALFCVALFLGGCAGSKKETKKEETAPAAEETAAPVKEEPAPAPVANASNLSIQDAVFCESVEELAPVSPNSSFKNDVGKVYLFTRIIGAEEETTIKHRWLKDGEEMAVVELPVGAKSWRTYSSKNIEPSWTGNWTVEVLDASGNVLATYNMTVEEAGAEVEEY